MIMSLYIILVMSHFVASGNSQELREGAQRLPDLSASEKKVE